jgi:excisionase family DNA binding protein
MLSISTRTLERLTAEGRIPRVPVGTRRYRYAVGDLKAWIERARTTDGDRSEGGESAPCTCTADAGEGDA